MTATGNDATSRTTIFQIPKTKRNFLYSYEIIHSDKELYYTELIIAQFRSPEHDQRVLTFVQELRKFQKGSVRY